MLARFANDNIFLIFITRQLFHSSRKLHLAFDILNHEPQQTETSALDIKIHFVVETNETKCFSFLAIKEQTNN